MECVRLSVKWAVSRRGGNLVCGYRQLLAIVDHVSVRSAFLIDELPLLRDGVLLVLRNDQGPGQLPERRLEWVICDVGQHVKDEGNISLKGRGTDHLHPQPTVHLPCDIRNSRADYIHRLLSYHRNKVKQANIASV